MKISLTKPLILFVVLTIAGICLAVFGREAADPAAQALFPLIGMVFFSAGLTNLLVKAS